MPKKFIAKYKQMPVQVKAAFWFLICAFLQKGISMITTPIFTRLMSTAEYGEFGVFSSWYSIVTIIVGLSLTAGVHTQGLIKYDRDRSAFTSALIGLTTVLTIAWIVVYWLFNDFWTRIFKMPWNHVLAMLIMVWTSAVFSFWANEQRVEYKYRALVIVTLVVSLAKPVLGILLVTHSNDKVTARILGLVLIELIGYSWIVVVQLRKDSRLFSKKYWIYALAFNLPLVPHYLSQTVLNGADRIMIKNMVGGSEAGIYNLAYSVSLIMTLFNTALLQTISPWMYQKIKEKKGKEIAPIAYGTLALIAIVNLLLILLAPEVIAIFAPKEYYEAIWVVPPVAMSVFFLYCYDLFAKFAFYYEKTGFIMVASVIGAGLNVVLNYFFINKFGYIAAGYTTLICYIVYSIAHYLFMKRVCDRYCGGEYPYNTKILLLMACGFVALGLMLLLTYKAAIVRYGIIIGAGALLLVFRKRIVGMIRKTVAVRVQHSGK